MGSQSPNDASSFVWAFGRYVDKENQTALLGIFYTIGGKPAKRPLVLPMSDIEKAGKVWNELMNAGADAEYLTDKQHLKQQLAFENLKQGIYARKLGWVDGKFITAPAFAMDNKHDMVIEASILDIAMRQHGCAGTPSDWKNGVAVAAMKSSYCAIAILQGFAAPLLSRVFPNGDEGFLINLAGDSSVGKTTCLMAGKSISGPGNELSTWDQTPRSLMEHAAAFSDNFMPIDDLDKVASDAGFARQFTRITHSLTSGASKQYAAMVKGALPDLRWTCCAMTGGRTTVDELSGTKQRENHERVRCLDLKVPQANDGGIWDRREAGDVPQQLSDELKASCTRAYGLPLRRWLKELHKEGTVERAGELVKAWVARLDLAETDGIGHRVAKKFGLLYAAGIMAVKAGILPWDEAFVGDVVKTLYANACETLYPHDKQIAKGLRRLSFEAKHRAADPVPTNQMPSFIDGSEAAMFVKASEPETVFVTTKYLKRMFNSDAALTLALQKLDRSKVVKGGPDGKLTRQLRVRVGDLTVKQRYIKVDQKALKRLVRNTSSLLGATSR